MPGDLGIEFVLSERDLGRQPEGKGGEADFSTASLRSSLSFIIIKFLVPQTTVDRSMAPKTMIRRDPRMVRLF